MRTLAALGLALGVVSSAMAAYRLEEHRTIGDAQPGHPDKVLVVGIADDQQVRNRFEEKFQSHLRTRGLLAMASHNLVPNLAQPGDRDQILLQIDEQGVDAVMTVRAVGMDATGEESWAATWNAWTASDPRIGELIGQSLPWPAKRSKRYGVEFGLWTGRPAHLVWAARSNVVPRKELQSGVGELLQLVIDGLKEGRWLDPRP